MKRFFLACFMSIVLLIPSFNFSSEALVEIAEKLLGDTVAESLAKAAIEAMGEDLIKALGEETVSALTKSFTETAANLMADAATKFGTELSTDAIAKLSEATIAAATDLFEEMGTKITADVMTDLTKTMATLTEDLSTDLSEKTVAQLGSTLTEAVNAGTMSALDATAIFEEATASKLGAEILTETAENTLKKGVTTLSEKTIAGLKTFGKEFGMMLLSSVIMMVPQTLMTGIATANTRLALLDNIIAPIKIGKFVLQIPDQFINTEDPSKSLYIYAIAPSASTTMDVPVDANSLWPGWYGLGSDNSISKASSNVIERYTFEPEFLQTAYFACTAPAASYSTTLADTYMNSSSAPGVNLVLNNGYKFVADGTNGGNSAMQLVGSVTSGFTVLSALTYLKNKIDTTAQDYDYTEYIDASATKLQDTVNTVASDGTISDVIDRLFNCSCLESGDYSNLDSTCSVTESGSVLATCMLKNSLAKLNSGTVIDQNGLEITNSLTLEGIALTDAEAAGTAQTGTATEWSADDDLGYQILNGILTASFKAVDGAISKAIKSTDGTEKPASTSTSTEKTVAAASLPRVSLAELSRRNDHKMRTQAQALTSSSSETNALGPVVTAFGWADEFDGMLKSFNASPTVTTSSSIVELATASGSSVATGTLQGAPVSNYAAKGVHVYVSGNTPFIRDLRESCGLASLNTISEMSPTSAFADMIVFLDSNKTQVPLMTVQPKVVYGSTELNNAAYLPEYVLNPEIKYWVSLVSGDLPQYYEQYGQAVMYDLQGNVYASGYTAEDIQKFFTAVGVIDLALEEQMLTHKSAMVNQYLSGPFGKNNLTTSSDLQLTGKTGSVYYFYSGLNPAGAPMGNQISLTDNSDGTQTYLNDYVMPFYVSSSGTANCILPDSDVTYYMGIVTDIKYEMKNGYLVPFDYEYSPLSVDADGNYVIDTTKSTLLYSYFDSKVDNFATTSFAQNVVESRSKWLSYLETLSATNISSKEINGFTVGSVTARLFSLESSVNGCPIWQLDDSPLEYGLFIATNSATKNSVTITPIKSENFTTSTVFVDLVSGMVVSQDGTYKQGLDGFNVCVNIAEVLSALKVSYPGAFTDSFNSYYSDYQTKYNTIADEMIYPTAFGSLQIGIYRGDYERENFVYWTFNGSEMTDYFVTVNSSSVLDSGQPDLSSAIFAGPFCSNTQFLLSLVNGQLYSLAGKSTTFSSYQSIVNTLAPSWRSEIEMGIAAKNVEFALLEEALQAESAKIAAATTTQSATTLKQTDTDRAGIATRLASASYLSYPHNTLKLDTTTGKYYHIGLADDGTTSTNCYLDFDTPNSGTTTSGDPVEIASLFYEDGKIIGADEGMPMIFNKMNTYSYRKQYGVGVSNGVQTLGAVGGQPALFLSSTDIQVATDTPGESAETMVNTSSENFPSVNIPASVTDGDKTFYYYYSLLMENYYALVVDSSKNTKYWMSIDGGSKYNLDGTSKAINNPLAVGAILTEGSSTVDNLLFARENDSGYMECWMPNKDNNNAYSKFVNLSSSFDGSLSINGIGICMNTMNAATLPFNQVKIGQTPRPATVPPVPPVTYATDYYVGWDEENADHYAVDSSYTWHHLQLMDDETSDYQDLCITLSSSNFLNHALFGGNLYIKSSYSANSTGFSANMTQVFNSSAATITIDGLDSDPNTGNKMITVTDSAGKVYRYQYDIDSLSEDQLSQYQLSFWKSQVVVNANGIVTLARNMSTNSDGSVSVSLVSYSDISKETLPVGTDGTVSLSDQSYLRDEVESLFYDSAQATYYYHSLADSVYVRIKDGVTFNSSGIPTGAYSASELTDLANTLKMTVVEKMGTTMVEQTLIYRASTN